MPTETEGMRASSGRGSLPMPVDREYAALVEQYKVFVEMADRISDRRQTGNAFFLSLHSLLVTAVATGSALLPARASLKFGLIIAIAGVFLSFVWWRLILSYRGLNSGKFAVIHALEARLPSQPYKDEWKEMGEGKDRKKYWPFTHLEAAIPWVFAVLYFAAISIEVLI